MSLIYLSQCCNTETLDEICLNCHKKADTYKVWNCRGCQSIESMERHDAYGITTGHWCEECYNDEDKYPYRKDRYPTIEHDGYGERLDDDY